MSTRRKKKRVAKAARRAPRPPRDIAERVKLHTLALSSLTRRLDKLEEAHGVRAESIRALSHQSAELTKYDLELSERLRVLAERVSAFEEQLGVMKRLEKVIEIIKARESYKLGQALETRIARVEAEFQAASPLHFQQHLDAAVKVARELMLVLDEAKAKAEAEGHEPSGTEGETVQ